MHFELTSDLPAEGVLALYCDAGWWSDGDDPAAIPEMLRHTPLIMAAFDGGKLVGMARALTDLNSDACIQDVVVLKEFRGRGVGGGLVRRLCAELLERGVTFIELIAVPGQQKFYENCGFKAMPDHVPMQLEVR